MQVSIFQCLPSLNLLRPDRTELLETVLGRVSFWIPRHMIFHAIRPNSIYFHLARELCHYDFIPKRLKLKRKRNSACQAGISGYFQAAYTAEPDRLIKIISPLLKMNSADIFQLSFIQLLYIILCTNIECHCILLLLKQRFFPIFIRRAPVKPFKRL